MTRLRFVLLSLMIAMPAIAAPDAAVPETETGAASTNEAARAPRLKFRSRRPVCLCGNGMSEKDIEQASRANANRPAEPHPTRSEK